MFALQGIAQVSLEATLYSCRDNATLPSPECEERVLAAVLDQVIQSHGAQQLWRAAGEPLQGSCCCIALNATCNKNELISVTTFHTGAYLQFTASKPPCCFYSCCSPHPAMHIAAASVPTASGIQSVGVGNIQPRQPPTPLCTTSTTSQDSDQQQEQQQQHMQEQGSWVPWHLDRLDQRSLPLDGAFAANATGRGVSVFVVSSVRLLHLLHYACCVCACASL